MNEQYQNKIVDEVISKTQNIIGVSIVYFLDNNFQIIKEFKKVDTKNYLNQVTQIIQSDLNLNALAIAFNLKPFHTYTFLNENGLILISTLQSKNLYLVIIAGEKEPTDLISLLKICKEARLSFQNLLSTNV